MAIVACVSAVVTRATAARVTAFPARNSSCSATSTSTSRYSWRRINGSAVRGPTRVTAAGPRSRRSKRFGDTSGVRVINNNNPADVSADEETVVGGGSSEETTLLRFDGVPHHENETEDSGMVCDSKKQCDADFIGVDELGVGIRGDARLRRRDTGRDAYWKEQALELEQALARSGDGAKSKVVVSKVTGRLLLNPVEAEASSEFAGFEMTGDDGEDDVSGTGTPYPDRVTASAPPDAQAASSQKETRDSDADADWTWQRRFALLAQISALGLPALVNSCVEPLLSSAETACAAKIGTVYLAALAPSSSLFAFAAEMCFAMSVVVTTAVAKAAAKAQLASDKLKESITNEYSTEYTQSMRSESEIAKETMRRTATAATTASFAVGVVLAFGLSTLAEPLLRVMHVPPEAAPIVRAYVATRALGLPFFAASNAAEGVYIGHGDGVTPMAAWTVTGAVTMCALLGFAHPNLLNWGLPGAAAAIACGQVSTAVWFARGMAKKGWLVRGNRASDETKASQIASRTPAQKVTSIKDTVTDAVSVLKATNMANEIGWMFVGAVSRMGTYAILTASASALGVIPGATHKVALEIYWLLSFLTEPIFTACNALLPRELAKGNIRGAQRLRNALVSTAVLLGKGLSHPTLSASAIAHTRTRREYYLCPDCLSIHRDIQD